MAARGEGQAVAIGAGSGAQQKASQNSAQGASSAGSAAQAQRAQIAAQLKAVAARCASQIRSSCQKPLAALDEQAFESAAQGCDEIANASQVTEADKTASGSMLDNLGQLASALGQALGALPQPQDQSATTPSGLTSDPYTNSYTPPDNFADSTVDGPASPSPFKLGDGTTNGNGVKIGDTTPGGASIAAPGNSAPTFANAGGYSPDGGGDSATYMDESLPGTELGAGGGGGGASVTPSLAGGGSGGAGGVNATGASLMKEADAAAAAAAGEPGAFELPVGGGGGKPAFLGLRSSAAELGDLGEGGMDGASELSAFGDAAMMAEEGDRSLASVEEADIHGEDGGSLFVMVRAKYAEIKKRGNI